MRSVNRFNACTVDVFGNIKEITPDNDQFFTLKEIYYHINSQTPEFLKTSDGRTIVCCEQLQTKDRERTNVTASLLYIHGDVYQVKGKVIICKTQFIN